MSIFYWGSLKNWPTSDLVIYCQDPNFRAQNMISFYEQNKALSQGESFLLFLFYPQNIIKKIVCI